MADGDAHFELTAGDLGSGDLPVTAWSGEEHVSRLFAFDIGVQAAGADEGVVGALLGEQASFRMTWSGNRSRTVFGLIAGIESERGFTSGAAYELRLVPTMWRLTRRRVSRIFQDKTVEEIVRAVMRPHRVPLDWAIVRPYPRRTYCVQYQETDYQFVTRLCAEEGIFFYFRHEYGMDGIMGQPSATDVVVFADEAAYPPIDDDPVLTFGSAGALDKGEGTVERFTLRRSLGAEEALIREYDWNRPKLKLERRALAPGNAGSSDGALFYEHQSHYDVPDYNRDFSPTYLEQLRSRLSVGDGLSTCRRILPGHTFTLEHHDLPSLNRAYVVTSIRHRGHAPDVDAGGARLYENAFLCVPAELPCRPERPDQSPTQVAETAIVVGPAGQDICTDELGRVKVQFHWDREGKEDENSSCFLRVAQGWAGAGWGSQFTPRVGMEVLVTFLGGDLDRPMITGAVYNATNIPPFPPLGDRARNGLKTMSTPGGGGYNELSFDDEAGSEEILIRAQKDLDEVVGDAHTVTVAGSETISIGKGQSIDVAGDQDARIAGDQTENVAGSQEIRVAGDRSDEVAGSSDAVIAGEATTRVEGRELRDVRGPADHVFGDDNTCRVAGCYTVLVGTHDDPRSFVVHAEGRAEMSSTDVAEIVSDKGIVLRCGKSSIRITPSNIELLSPAIVMSGGGSGLSLGKDAVKVKSKGGYSVKADEIVLQSSGASIGLTSEVKIDGAQILLNSPSSATDPPAPEAMKPTKIELLDEEGKPLPYQRFVIAFEDGSELGGFVDDQGKAEVDIDGAGAKIRFPDLEDTKKV